VTGRRHARRAALPPAGYARDRQPGPGSLAVTVAGESGGTEAVFNFSALPGPPALLAACAAGFARMAGSCWRRDSGDRSQVASPYRDRPAGLVPSGRRSVPVKGALAGTCQRPLRQALILTSAVPNVRAAAALICPNSSRV
jgi:hypothetical protein